MKCYLTGIDIDENNKSEEHIIPNALGGHIKNYYILCHDANQSLNTQIDIPFNKIFEPIYRRLILKKDRASKSGIKGIHTQFQEEIVFKENRCFPYKPLHDEENKTLYVNTRQQGEGYIKHLKKNRKIKPDEIIEIKTDLSGEVEFEFNLESSIFPKGFAKIAAGFASLKGIERNNLKNIINSKTSSFCETIPLIPYFPLNPIDLFIEDKRSRMTKYPLHTIVLKGCNKENILYCFIELFSTFKFIVIIDDKYDGGDIYHYYAYDLLNSKKIEANDYIESLDVKFYLPNNCLYNYSISQLNEMNHYAKSKNDLIKLMSYKWFKELESFITFLNIENKFKTH